MSYLLLLKSGLKKEYSPWATAPLTCLEKQFAKHPRFRYFALNTEMRWRALQTGRIYINQHPEDARLTLDELRDMVGREGEIFSKRVLYFASSLRGTTVLSVYFACQ